MYALAYKCNACGLVSKAAGTHCNAPMVSVIVMENIWPEPAPAPVIIREVVREVIKEVPVEREHHPYYTRYE